MVSASKAVVAAVAAVGCFVAVKNWALEVWYQWRYVPLDEETKICQLIHDIAELDQYYPPGHLRASDFDALLPYKKLFPWVQSLGDVGLYFSTSGDGVLSQEQPLNQKSLISPAAAEKARQDMANRLMKRARGFGWMPGQKPEPNSELQRILDEHLLGFRIVEVLTESELRSLYDENLMAGSWKSVCRKVRI